MWAWSSRLTGALLLIGQRVAAIEQQVTAVEVVSVARRPEHKKVRDLDR